MPYDDNNKGVLFANRKKTPGSNPKLPDYTGKIKIDGVEYKLAGWKATSPKVKGNYLQLKVSQSGGGGGQDIDF